MAMDFSIPFSSNGDKETMNIDKCFNCNEKPVFISDEDDIGYKFNLVHRTSGCPHHSYVHDDSKNDCIKYWNESNERRKRGYL